MLLSRSQMLPRQGWGAAQLLSLGVSSQLAQATPIWEASIADRLPTDTWDSHMHVVDPIRYPLAASAVYTPPVHTLIDAIYNECHYNMRNIVLVQPSIYEYDNSYLLDALKEIGPDRARAVVQFEPTIANSTLAKWHELGVRGVRLNLQSTGTEVNATSFAKTIKQYAALIEPFGWTLQAYLPMELLAPLEDTIRELGVNFCVDHFGQPTADAEALAAPQFDPYTIAGFPALIRLLAGGNTWVKFSASYRVNLSSQALAIVAKEILRVRSDRVVFATDWPHTRFEGVDALPFEKRVLEWSEAANCVEQVFSTNAKVLWGIFG